MESDVMAASCSGGGGGEVEETSPDMLKNTPLNIMRLASEIEQCEGRQKYLAHTSSPSDSGDVRWYFCKVPLAANGQCLCVTRADFHCVLKCFHFFGGNCFVLFVIYVDRCMFSLHCCLLNLHM